MSDADAHSTDLRPEPGSLADARKRSEAAPRARDEAASAGLASWGSPSVLPYLGATGVATTAMVLLVVATALPAAGVFQVGLTFLAIAMGVRRLQDIPADTESRLLRWAAGRLDRIEDRFGVELYGIASLTAFLRLEVGSLSRSEIGLQELLSDPVVSLVTWFVSELLESLMNGIWAALWWLEILRVDGVGIGLLVVIVACAGAVWRVLEISPEE